MITEELVTTTYTYICEYCKTRFFHNGEWVEEHEKTCPYNPESEKYIKDTTKKLKKFLITNLYNDFKNDNIIRQVVKLDTTDNVFYIKILKLLDENLRYRINHYVNSKSVEYPKGVNYEPIIKYVTKKVKQMIAEDVK